MTVKFVEKVEIKFWTFPGGERSCKIINEKSYFGYNSLTLEVDFTGSDDLIDMMLVVNALRNMYYTKPIHLLCKYFPFARQDRVMSNGEPFALQIPVQMIKLCKFETITVWDAHSDVLAGMFDPGTLINIAQHDILYQGIRTLTQDTKKGVALVSPDAGAVKKIHKLAQHTRLPVIEASKVRSVEDGSIIGTSIPLSSVVQYDTLIICDDICDGGRTFIELAKKIREVFRGDLFLCVTHGIFSKGFDELEQHFDGIYAANDMRKVK